MSNHLQSFNALIVDPNVETRMRLKTATTAVNSLKKIQLVNKTSEGISRLTESEFNWDLVFVSANIPRDEIAEFIKTAKETKIGGLCAYVLVMATKEQDSASIAENILLGGDGFLFEPYSIDALIEITDLATRVRHERLAAREKGAIALMIPDLIAQVDLIAYLRSSGAEPGQSFKKFREMTGMPEKFERHAQAYLFRTHGG